ncbi:phage regulatory protein/antirepressor Ant [Paenibacillus ottowii]|nr:phage regulatory protein/antirepressor Ant [Paenibacillus ottowii]
MNELTIILKNNQLLVDSREVAVMTEKEHSNLMRDIRGYVDILEKSKLNSRVFFIPSTYKVESNNKTYDCFLITRKGCDMVANKMTGEKGVLFTATYVMKFAEMEQQLFIPKDTPSYMIDNRVERAKKWIQEEEARQELETKTLVLEQRVKEYEPKLTYLDQILISKDAVTITQIAKDYGLSGTALNQILHEEKVQYKQNKQWLLYSKYQDKGYTKSQTLDILHNNGERTVKMNTRWTQKGRLFIHELLGKRGILPFMDRENPGA